MNWISIGLKFVPIIIEAIHATERYLDKKRGAEKEDHALQLVESGVEILEGVTGKDLVRNEAVQPAAREFIRAYVGLQNAIRAAKALPPASS